MMPTSEQFITQMKLHELRKQRTRLQLAYDTLERESAAIPAEAEQVRQLYQRLQNIRIANQALHPEVSNLEPLMAEIALGRATQESIAFWKEQLEQQVRQGRLRSEIIYIFGALLEEWATKGGSAPIAGPEVVTIRERMVEALCREASPTVPADLLERCFADLPLKDETVAAALQELVDEQLDRAITLDELREILAQLTLDRYRPADVRQQAERFRVNPILLKEFADALTIMLSNLDEWRWPEEGVPATARWARHKWRLFIDDDLATACLLELLGTRWHAIFTRLFDRLEQREREQLARMVAKEPALLTQEQWLTSYGGLNYLVRGVDSWAGPGASPTTTAGNILRRWGEHTSVFAHRAKEQKRLRQLKHLAGAHGSPYANAMDTVLALINADIQLARAAFPDGPLYVLKIDLKDFYPSLSHELVLATLERWGLTPTQRDFFQRFLSTPFQGANAPQVARRGVPNDRWLSHLVAELVLRLLDRILEQRTAVQVVRLVDDICLITPFEAELFTAWQELQHFCEATGLTISAEKSGLACINAPRPADLPAGQPSWQLVSLENSGEWTVNRPDFESFLAEVRTQVQQAPALLSRVEIYNSNARYLAGALSINVALGEQHRRHINEALLQFHNDLMGEGLGIVDSLRMEIQQRFTAERRALHLPEAWFYWPLTAGGLGLFQPSIEIARYLEGLAMLREHVPAEAPTDRTDDWLRRRNEWSRYYHNLLTPIPPGDPAPQTVMESRVKDFIARGADISDNKQQTLSSYWRWILYTYGPQLLAQLGTFRFLITELVPIQLLTQRRLGGLELDELTEEA